MPPVSAVGTLPLAARRTDPQARTAAFAARLLTFRARAADQDHAAFTPGTTWPIIETPARLITGEQLDPPLSMPPPAKRVTGHERPALRLPRASLAGRRLPCLYAHFPVMSGEHLSADRESGVQGK